MPGSATFNPEAITLLRGVLDEVWAEIKPLTNPDTQNQVREKIGEAVMAIAANIGSRDRALLKAHALQQAHIILKNNPSAADD